MSWDYKVEQIVVIDAIYTLLRDHHYDVLRPMGLFDPKYWIKTSFDIAARKEALLLIKVVLNIDKISAELIEDLKLITYFFNGTPLVIGRETRKEQLQNDVIYERRGIPTMNMETFRRVLKNNEIHIISRKGGFYIKIDKEKLQELRSKKGFSLQDVAKELGVSRKAVYLFERSDQIKKDNALELERLFKQTIKRPLNIFNWEIEREKKEVSPTVEETESQAEIKEIFEGLGYNTYWAKKAPFDAIASDADSSKENALEKTLITSLSKSHKMQIYNRLQLISEISKVARKLSMFIIDEGKLPPIDNVLILQKTILEKMKDISDLYDKLKEIKRNFEV